MPISNTLSILIAMIIAHVLADFSLQSNCIAKRKSKNNLPAHFIHAAIQALLIYLVTMQWSSWYITLPYIFITHFIIDYFKNRYVTNHKIWWFILDQATHLLLIGLLWYILFKPTELVGCFKAYALQNSTSILVILLAYLLLFVPCSILIGMITSQWTPQPNEDKDSITTESLYRGGRWIGYLERFLIVTAILMSVPEMIGWLLAAKSIFRFGELNRSKDIQKTEYVLIGTLCSFSISIAIGYFTKFILMHS